MAVLAIQAIRKMRGSSQSQLVLGSDGNLWVVKFQNNPQHTRVLVNELIATHLAAAIGLTVPEASLVCVPPSLIDSGLCMNFEMRQGERRQYKAGIHFGSKFAGGLLPGLVVDYIPAGQLKELVNIEEFAGMLCLDKWTCNCDHTQAIFIRKANQRRYRASFIDRGCCFNTGEWNFPDAPLRSVYLRNEVYAQIKGWESFEPWLQRIEDMELDSVLSVVKQVPEEWCGSPIEDLERLIEQLFRRKQRIRGLIEAFRDSDRQPFPQWCKLKSLK